MTLRVTELRVSRALFVVAWLVISAPWLSGKVTIPYDAKALFQAQLQFLASSLHRGDSPFWNPYAFLGMPQISDPQSLIFSPAAFIAFLFKEPPFQYLDLYVLSLLAVGGLAILSHCVDRGWHCGGACVAGIVFAFGGAAPWRLQHISHIQSYALFAIALWALYRALDRRQVGYFSAAGVAWGVMLMEPDQMALLGSYALVATIFAACVQEIRRRSPLRWLVLGLVATLLVCIAIAIVPLSLTYLFLVQSNRPSISLTEAAHGSLHPGSLLTALVPDLYGATGPAYWGPYSQSWSPDDLTLSQNMGQFYLGVLPALLLLSFGVVRGHLWDRQVRLQTALLVFALIYAVGTFTPLYQSFYAMLPGVSAFRRPVDALLLAGAMSSILAGYLVHLWVTGSVRKASHASRFVEMAAFLLILAGALAIGFWQSHASEAARSLYEASGWIIIGILFGLIPQSIRRNHCRGVIVAVVVLLATDLAFHNGPNESSGIDPSRISGVLAPDVDNATIRFLKSSVRDEMGAPWRDRVELVGLGFDWQNSPSIHRLESTLGYNPFRLGAVSKAIGARDYNVGPDQRTFSPLFPSYNSLLARMLGLRFVVSSIPIEEIDSSLRKGGLDLVRRTSDGFVYENMRVLPRVLLVEHSISTDFDSLLETGMWPTGFDPMRSVLLNHDDVETVHAPVRGLEDNANSGARIMAYSHDEVVTDVQAQRSSFLVLNDLWHPWWEAFVDGAAVPLLRANGIFRAVRLDSGQHIVTFKFRPLQGALRQSIEMLSRKLGVMTGSNSRAAHDRE